eukprot:705748-Rhodomonas_salina.2
MSFVGKHLFELLDALCVAGAVLPAEKGAPRPAALSACLLALHTQRPDLFVQQILVQHELLHGYAKIIVIFASEAEQIPVDGTERSKGS